MKGAAADGRQKKIILRFEKSLYGYGFIGLWLLGTLIFFLIPLVKSLWYSFNEVSIDTGSMITEWAGFDKYKGVLTSDPYYTEYLRDTLIETAWKTPMILIFSLFIAVILNQKFRGRVIARAVFFLPVIIATGPVYKIISGDMNTTGNAGGGMQFSTMFSIDLMGELLQFLEYTG